MSNQSTSPESADDVFGDTSYTNRKYEILKFKKEDDCLVLRPLPGMKSLRARRDCGIYYKLHYRVKILNDKGEEWSHTVLCIEEKDYGKIVQSCCFCDERKEHKDNLDSLDARIKELKKIGKAKGATGAQIAAKVAPLQKEWDAEDKWLYDNSVDGKFRLPCINQKGEFVLFLMPWNCLKDFRESMRKLNSKGIDPLGNKANGFKGLWFEFTRSGKASPTSDKAVPLQIEQEDGSLRYSYHTLDAATAKAAFEAFPDLVEEMEKRRISPDLMQKLLDGSGDPEENMKLLGIENKSEAAAEEESESAEDAPATSGNVEEDPFGDVTPATTDTASADEEEEEVPATVAADEDDGEEEAAAALAAAEAAVAAAKARTAAKKTAPVATGKPAAAGKPVAGKPATKAAGVAGAVTMSDDDFDTTFPK